MAEQYDHDQILGYVEGDLSGEDQAALEAQMRQDAALRSLVEGLIRDCQALRSLPRERPPEGLTDDALQHTERTMLLGDPVEALSGSEPVVQRRFRIGRALGYGAIAACILISAGLLVSALVAPGLLEEARQYAGVGEQYGPGGQVSMLAQADPDRQQADGPRASEAETPPEAPNALEAPPETPPESPPEALAMQSMEMPEPPEELLEMSAARAAAKRRSQREVGLLLDEVRSELGGQRGDAVPLPRPVVHGWSTGLEQRIELPRMRLVVHTSDAAEARRDVLQWAASHGVPVLAAGKPVKWPGPATVGEGASQVVVQVAAERVPALLAQLNRGPRRAQLQANAAGPVMDRSTMPPSLRMLEAGTQKQADPAEQAAAIEKRFAAISGGAGGQDAANADLPREMAEPEATAAADRFAGYGFGQRLPFALEFGGVWSSEPVTVPVIIIGETERPAADAPDSSPAAPPVEQPRQTD